MMTSSAGGVRLGLAPANQLSRRARDFLHLVAQWHARNLSISQQNESTAFFRDRSSAIDTRSLDKRASRSERADYFIRSSKRGARNDLQSDRRKFSMSCT